MGEGEQRKSDWLSVLTPEDAEAHRRASAWHDRLVQWGTNVDGSRDGSFELYTLVGLGAGVSLILLDAYWGDLCVCEVNRVLGVPGPASIITVWLFSRESGETWRLNGLPRQG